jgi:AraC-like DNA-binding protein
MQHQEFDPPEELQNIIKCFWYDKRDCGKLQSSYGVVPDGYAEIIFHFGGPLSIYCNDRLQPLPSPFMMGLQNQPIVFHTEHHLEIIAIRCFPWTVFDLLGLPPGKDGVRVFEHAIAGLQSILSKFIKDGKINEAIGVVKHYFMYARLQNVDDNMLFKAGVAMREANGNIPVSGVAAAAHATVRTLERKFKSAAGYTVKDVAGLMRFEQVRNQLWHNPDVNIAGLAHELGYTDQSHLSREFKRYSGTTPRSFSLKAKKGKKAVGVDFVTFIQA